MGGLSPPVFSASDTEILFRVPWEASITAPVTIPAGGAPYFDDSAHPALASFLPEAIALGQLDPNNNSDAVAIHSDFRSLVSTKNPALPGETLHIYFTGGGAVSPPVPTAAAAPLQPLSRITTPISATADDDLTPITVPFFGLAPGLTGIWQMDMIVPPSWSFAYLSPRIGFYAAPPDAFGVSISTPAIPIGKAP